MSNKAKYLQQLNDLTQNLADVKDSMGNRGNWTADILYILTRVVMLCAVKYLSED